MKNRKSFLWRFTLVNRFTRETIEECFLFGVNLPAAVKRLRNLFPLEMYDVTEVHIVENDSLVVVGFSNYNVL